MIRRIKVTAIFFMAIFLFIAMDFCPYIVRPDLPLGSKAQFACAQITDWYNSFHGSWLADIYVSQLSYPYSTFGEYSFQYPVISFATTDIFAQYEFLAYVPLKGLDFQGQFNLQTAALRLPFGCQPSYEKKTCRLRGACHTPIYCPVFIPNLFNFTSGLGR